MFDSRQACVHAVEGVAAALNEAQRALKVAEVASRKALASETGGVTSAAVLRAAPIAPYRLDLDTALATLERARHMVVLASFVVALEDGMSIGELSRNHGFSRQRGARYAKEAKAWADRP
jgi:hypothetical protein